MPKAKYILSSPDVDNPIKGEKGDTISVYSDKDLKRRVAAAKGAGVRVTVRRAQD